MTTTIHGTLEIDYERGALYFHPADGPDLPSGGVPTALRICGLPKPIPDIHDRMLDITVRPIRIIVHTEKARYVAFFDWAER